MQLLCILIGYIFHYRRMQLLLRRDRTLRHKAVRGITCCEKMRCSESLGTVNIFGRCMGFISLAAALRAAVTDAGFFRHQPAAGQLRRITAKNEII